MQTQTAFVPSDYLRVIASQLGVNVTDIPLEVMADIKAKRSANGVNEVFFRWMAARREEVVKQTGFSSEDLVFFDQMKPAMLTSQYQTAKNNWQSSCDNINRYMREVHVHAQRAFDYRIQMETLASQPTKTMRDWVEAIIADGWYKYAAKETKELNAMNTSKSICFTTPRINMKYYNKDRATDLNIDMGEYLIQWYPHNGSMKVRKHNDNLVVGTEPYAYYHAHVSYDGTICWGNAGDRVSLALQQGDPRPMFNALKVILQTYNEESPYAQAAAFAAKREPSLVASLPVEYSPAGDWDCDYSYVWVLTEELFYGDVIVLDTRMNGDDEEESEVKLYVQVRGGEVVDMNKYFLRRGSGSYVELDKAIVQEWN